MQIEICAGNLQSALNASKAGANRIELCTELSIGGLTPSYGLLEQVTRQLQIPVHVLIRPRSGNFSYSDAEFEVIKTDILHCKEKNCAAVVSGILTKENTIDISRTTELVQLAKPMKFIFHRAFDWVKNPIESLEQLIKIGVNGILSSGGHKTAYGGIDELKKWHTYANHKMEIIPGGGINADNIKHFKTAGFDIVHSSASTITYPEIDNSVELNNLDLLQKNGIIRSDLEKIKTLIQVVK
ncbi:MAG: copper homeostasis protein CutC [Flavobacteriales bacterium]|nr:MAG: copper homeostasis protein CutC [Flavobacteriales bacterium]